MSLWDDRLIDQESDEVLFSFIISCKFFCKKSSQFFIYIFILDMADSICPKVSSTITSRLEARLSFTDCL